jgi:hypothetical protein
MVIFCGTDIKCTYFWGTDIKCTYFWGTDIECTYFGALILNVRILGHGLFLKGCKDVIYAV